MKEGVIKINTPSSFIGFKVNLSHCKDQLEAYKDILRTTAANDELFKRALFEVVFEQSLAAESPKNDI